MEINPGSTLGRSYAAMLTSSRRSIDTHMVSPSSSGPNPLCEVGKNHPRDKHRMRPVEGVEHTWTCARHSMFAQLVDKATAEGLERNDPYPLPDGGEGLVVRHGDERQGGVILYYRAR